MDKKKTTLRKLKEVAANRIAEIRSSGIDDPKKDNRSLDATATKESLLHQCIKARSGLMQQMKKELAADVQNMKSNNNKSGVTPSSMTTKSQSPRRRKKNGNDDENAENEDDDDDLMIFGDDDDDDDEDGDGGNEYQNDFHTPMKRNGSTNSSQTLMLQQQQQQPVSFSAFARDFISAISSDKEKQQFEGKIATLESKMRILQQLENECSQIPILEERLRAATKRL